MKKTTISLILVLSLLIPLAFVGCNKKPTNETVDKVVLADFEQWAPDFQIMRLMNNFGAVSQNDDQNFVKSGKYSAKLYAMGAYVKKTVPYLYFNFASEHFDYNYCDLTKIESISLQVYNAQQQAKKMSIGFIAAINDINSTDKFESLTVNLIQGWNDIVFYPDLSLINISYDVTDIKGLYLEFENAGVRDKKDAPVYYLDDIVLHKAKTIVEVPDIVTLNAGEICDFERTYQKYVITSDVTNSKCIPDISVISAGDENIIAPSGKKVLKLVTYPGDSQNASWPRITIPEKIVRKSGFMNIEKSQWANYEFKFEVYAVDRALTFFPEFYSQEGSNWTATNIATKVGSWVTYSKSFTEFKEEIIKNPGFIKIAWGEYPGDSAYTFYFDNFRFEKIN